MLVQSIPYPSGVLPVGTIEYLSATTTLENSNVSTFAVNAPSIVDEGDFLLAFLGIGQENWCDPPSGWTVVGRMRGARAVQNVFCKFASVSEPSTYDFSFVNARRGAAAVLRFTGVDPTMPINHVNFGRSLSNATAHIVPERRTYDAKAFLVDGAVGGFSGTWTYTPPSGVTEVADIVNSSGSDFGSLLGVGTSGELGSVGMVSQRTWTSSASLHYSTCGIALTPENGARVNRGLVQNHAVSRLNPAGTSITANLPSGIASGDLLIAFVGAANAADITTPSGWAQIEKTLNGNARFAAYSRVADGSEGSTQAFALSLSTVALATVIRLRGQSGSPIDASAIGTTALTCPTLTTTGSGRTLLSATYAISAANLWPRTPQDTDLIVSNENRGTTTSDGFIAVGARVLASAGSTGTTVYSTQSATGSTVNISIAIA